MIWHIKTLLFYLLVFADLMPRASRCNFNNQSDPFCGWRDPMESLFAAYSPVTDKWQIKKGPSKLEGIMGDKSSRRDGKKEYVHCSHASSLFNGKKSRGIRVRIFATVNKSQTCASKKE